MSEPDCSQQAYAEAKHEYETRREGEVSDIVERARLVQRVNAHWSDSICECEECTQERFSLITPMADEIERLRARLAEAERERGHGPECNYWSGSTAYKCTCGLDADLAALERKP